MKCVCVSDRGGGETVVDHVRLFRRRPDVRWDYRVHEQVLPALRRSGADVRRADVAVLHVGYRGPALRGRELQRDPRLLEMEYRGGPDEPFTLFNLGQVYRELGRHAEALAVLRRSLGRSHPKDSIVRKLYSLIAACLEATGRTAEALGACAEGLTVSADDPELPIMQATLRERAGDLPGAVASARRLLASGGG